MVVVVTLNRANFINVVATKHWALIQTIKLAKDHITKKVIFEIDCMENC